jgi:hypothetical protein
MNRLLNNERQGYKAGHVKGKVRVGGRVKKGEHG